MLCFSHDWNGDPLSKTHLMRLLARDNRILWVNSIGYRTPSASARDFKRAYQKLAAAAAPVKEVEPNIFVLNPLLVPAHGSQAIRSFNRSFLRFQIRRAMRKLRMKNPVNWVFNPAAAIVAGHLGEESLIYYCVDEYIAFSGVSRDSLAQMEQGLLRQADLVVVSAEKLLESKRQFNHHIHLVRHGVDFDHFRTALDPETAVPEEIRNLPGPIIGYFGLIAEDWVDIDLLVHVAKAFPHASIVMLGKITMDVSRLKACPNIHLLGRKPYSALPAYCKGFDVGLIPFPINEATLNSNPLKAREYLAAGLPVISTNIPEVAVLNQCAVATDREHFVALLRAALQSPGPDAARSQAVRNESWNARLARVDEYFQAAIAARDQNRPAPAMSAAPAIAAQSPL
ncbi:MAG TPA: glycosyltransferase [Phycisphaerae bacterium]|nr:glycosyltransferase [Phycisphaerae bacterium]